MTDKELMQQALDALFVATTPIAKDRQEVLRAQEALRARLAQCDRCGENNPAEIHTCTPIDHLLESGCGECGKKASDGWALYCVECSKPMREWVGLTGEELQDIYQGGGTVHFKLAMAEAKLKEKNS